MAGGAFLGYALIGLGPCLAIFFTSIIHRPFLGLIALTSSFFWLVAFILLALLWRPFLPSAVTSLSGLIALTPLSGAALLLSAVLSQELAHQYLVLASLRWMEGFLNKLASMRSLKPVSLEDKVSVATAAGFGRGAAHAVFFFLSIATPTLGAATLYLDVCPEIPFFLIVGLLSAAFSVIHTTATVTAVVLEHKPKGYRSLPVTSETSALLAEQCQPGEEQDQELSLQVLPAWTKLGSVPNPLLAPGIHALAAFSTLLNLWPMGCYVGVPAVWVCAVLACLLCCTAIKLVQKRSLDIAQAVF